ncbi:MAG: hypothetical protein U0164_24675 [Gemmatimonadaceae bacterium]
MIPPTPILLVASALAMARQGARLVRRYPDIPCSLEFVQMLGRATHFDLQRGGSSFPVVDVASLVALRSLAERREWGRVCPAPGDMLLTGCSPGDGADGIHAGPGEVSVVLEVGMAAAEGRRTLRRCMLATGRADPVAPRGIMRVVESVQWCDTSGDDLAIRWYAMPEEYEAAA